MLKNILLILLVTAAGQVPAQRLHLGLFGGVSAYNGDLTDKFFPRKVSNGVIGITASYELRDQLLIRSGLSYTVVGGADRYNDKPDLVMRNLSFETSIAELSLTGEYYLRNLYSFRFSPYAFAGLALFRFNPYTYDGTGGKVFLRPLSTEGQGLTGYTLKPYGLTQLAIPFGAGIKYRINDNLRLGLEFGFRKLFTDYLDDVSGAYADEADLLTQRGPQSVALSYRSDEVGGSFLYPSKGAQRGSPKYKDIYYFTGLHLTYRIVPAIGGDPMRKNRNGCPVNVY